MVDAYSVTLQVFCSPGRSVPRALNPSLIAFVNTDACFLKSSGLLKVTVCSLSAKEIRNSRLKGM